VIKTFVLVSMVMKRLERNAQHQMGLSALVQDARPDTLTTLLPLPVMKMSVPATLEPKPLAPNAHLTAQFALPLAAMLASLLTQTIALVNKILVPV
jgi:hypothetical protein